MLRASARTPDGRRIIILGIEDENVRRLVRGQNIAVDLAPLGVSGVQVFLFHGSDEAALRRKFAELAPQAPATAAAETEPG